MRASRAMSHEIYRTDRRAEASEISELWKSLPKPPVKLEVDVSQLNYFQPTDAWVASRKRAMGREIAAILAVLRGGRPELQKVKCSRYLPSLRRARRARSSDLGPWLHAYSNVAALGLED